MLFIQVEELRQRHEEKNRIIEKKTQIALQATQERNRFTAEVNEMRDHLDIRDRKINVLQRKVTTLTINLLPTPHCIHRCDIVNGTDCLLSNDLVNPVQPRYRFSRDPLSGRI